MIFVLDFIGFRLGNVPVLGDLFIFRTAPKEETNTVAVDPFDTENAFSRVDHSDAWYIHARSGFTNKVSIRSSEDERPVRYRRTVGI